MTEVLNSSVVLYQHPQGEGGAVEYFDNQLIVCDGEGNCTSTPVDKDGLLALADKIKATLKASEKAERSGAKQGSKLTEELIALKGNPVESFAALRKSLSKLAGYQGPSRDEYISGFCMGLLPVATIGAVNFPSGKCEEQTDTVF